ncbi:amidohydrolase [Ensifer adhaerens]|uniref:amidohydrolase n=1 Tax=Ensifer adhaerens TaxID=106592 RepID=UPI0008073CA7|nr:amidohydrolase [Ensifer adhaerens]
MARNTKRTLRSLTGLLLAASALCSATTAIAETLVITDAKVRTMNPAAPLEEAVAINEDGVIVAVGDEASVLEKAGKDAHVVKLGGRMVLPGFQDAHVHLVEAGINASLCEFEPFASLEETEDTVRDCVKQSQQEWVVGSGVSMTNLLDETDDPVGVLDKISSDRPILILDDIGHGAWANSVALEAAGYDKIEGNPPGGIILRDEKTGAPNGIVLENAQQKLRNLAFPDTPENVEFAYESMLPTLKTMAENGITTVSDAGGFWPQGHLKAWEMAEKNDTLTLRAANALYVYPDLPFDEQVEKLTRFYSNDPNRLLKFNQMKIYVDGILEQRTGALLAPYNKGPGIDHGFDSGFLYFDEATLDRYSKVLSEKGFKLHYHVTGDRGARLALDAIAQSDPKPGPHRLTHIYLLDEADYGRFKDEGVVADFQLAPSSLSREYDAFIRKFIGERADHMMPAGSIEKSGATVVMSSDFDADELSPLVKIQTALQRKKDGAPDVETAVKWMTINPAKLLNQDDKTGTIEPGKFADLVVIDRDIFEIPVKEIGKAAVEATLLQGDPVYDAEGLFSGN